MTVKVTFCMHTAYQYETHETPCVTEQQLEAEFDIYSPKLLKNEEGDGLIIISSHGQPDILIQDALWAIVQNLCFGAIPDLIVHKSVVVPIWSNIGSVRLNPEDSYVHIAGDGIHIADDKVFITGDKLPDIKLPHTEFVLALYHCGQRFIKFYRRLGAGGILKPGFDYSIEDEIERIEREYAEIATQALINVGLL